jgi:hypothetical protein
LLSESGNGPEMKELTSTSFGYLIAYLLPGLLGLYGASYWIPEVGTTLQPITSANAAVGPSFLLLVIAVGMGLCLSAARHFLLAKFFYERILGYECLPGDLYKSSDSTKLAWHRALAEEHYRYHQFYGGSAVAVLVMFVGWLVHGHLHLTFQFLYMSLGFVFAEPLLERSSADAYGQYVQKCKALASAPPTKDAPHD